MFQYIKEEGLYPLSIWTYDWLFVDWKGTNLLTKIKLKKIFVKEVKRKIKS